MRAQTVFIVLMVIGMLRFHYHFSLWESDVLVWGLLLELSRNPRGWEVVLIGG